MIKNKKLIIFNLDDTLIISNIDYNRLRKEVIYFLDPKNSEELSKKPISELLQILNDENASKADKALAKIKELENFYTSNAKRVNFAENIPEILDEHDLFYAIMTNNTRDSLKNYLNNTSFSFLKKFYILTRDEAKMKPDPEGIFKIIQHFQDHKITKENTVYIGDSFIDANASYNAGIDFIHFHSRDVDFSQFKIKPSVTLDTWEDFDSFIKQIT